ncbi:hypothetical protein [Streptomyces sp. NBC_00102]|uniref:hypothetical protein n=1 Tax=Streptomyces sp. NBC_00102 TaxID=2975652 RepID=UPI002255897E|nr:hypothetical protein [Streptomyces sp. NBC_00102]MCX5402134.1 hypothetical protein [Streptomyces sp. NBC_00102]
MLDTPEAVVEALRENFDRPHGLARTVTAEELVEAAEAFEKPDVLVTALLELMTAYEYVGEHAKSPVTFARLLKLWDTTPESFSEWEGHQVFWRFKWVTTSLLQVPEVPLASVHRWIDEMRRRYEAAGHSLQPVAAMRHHIATHTGVGVADAYDLWVTRPRSRLSDCEACEIRHLALYQVATGDDASALETWAPVLGGGTSCTEEPQMSQAEALLPLLRLGRTDEARSHHLTGYRRVRGNTGMLGEVGLHLEFCALSRNEGRGLEILAENRPLFEATGAPGARLNFLTGVEVLLAPLVENGHADTAVAGPPGRNWTAGELLVQLRSDADRIAAAFDARNGTTAVGDRRRLRLAQRPLLDEPLSLGLRISATRPAAPAVAAPAAALDVPDDFVALVREARRLLVQGHPGARRLWARVAERLADGTATHDDVLGPEGRLTAEVAQYRAVDGFSFRTHAPESYAGLREAADLFAAVDMGWLALAARCRVLAWASAAEEDLDGAAPDKDKADDGRPDAETVRAALDEALREAERLVAEVPFTSAALGAAEAASGEDLKEERVQAYLSVLFSVAFAAHQELRLHPEEPGEVLKRFEAATDRLRSEAERLGVPHQVANARQFVADVAGERGDTALAEAQMRQALQEVEAAGRPWRGSRTRALLAQLLVARGKAEEATELLHRVISDVVRHDDAEFELAGVYALLGHAATHLGNPADAVRHLSESAARYDQEEEYERATGVRLQLADVLARSGQQADAVAVLESVLSQEALTSIDERMLAQARLLLARGMRELEEFLPAAEEFLRLADTVAAWDDDRETLTLVAAETAITLALADRWEAAGTAYDRALAAHAEAPNPSLIRHMMCEFARLVMVFRGTDGLEAALEHLTRAEQVRPAGQDASDESFVPWYEDGAVHYRRARVLAEAERFPEALAAAEAAIASHDRGGKDGEIPRAEAVRIAALIEGNALDRRTAAIARLTAAAARCREAGIAEAAGILDALRAEYLKQQG